MDDFKRREFIKLSALGFAGIALQLNSISTYAQKANGYLGKWNADTFGCLLSCENQPHKFDSIGALLDGISFKK